MKKPAQVNNAIVAKCCDGAFRKINLIDHQGDGINATTSYGVQGIVHGRYSINDNDQPVFVKAS